MTSLGAEFWTIGSFSFAFFSFSSLFCQSLSALAFAANSLEETSAPQVSLIFSRKKKILLDLLSFLTDCALSFYFVVVVVVCMGLPLP
jgi:hypothetical protein